MMSIGTIILELVQNMSLFAAVVVGYAAIRRRPDMATWLSDLLIGLLFGAGTVLAMSLTIKLSAGIILDGRAVLTGSVAFFAGPLGSAVALLIAAIYRYQLGGGAALAGIVTVVVAGVVGQLVFWVARRHGWKQGPLLFFGLGLLVVCCNSTVYELLYHDVVLPEGFLLALFIGIPVGTMIVGVALRREDARVALQLKLAEQTALSEAIFKSMSDGVTSTLR